MPLGRTMIATTPAFRRTPPQKACVKSFRRRNRRSGPKHRSGRPRSGRELDPAFRPPRAEDPPSRLGGHPRPEAVAPLAFEVARLKCALHRTVSALSAPVRARRRHHPARKRKTGNLTVRSGKCQSKSPRPTGLMWLSQYYINKFNELRSPETFPPNPGAVMGMTSVHRDAPTRRPSRRLRTHPPCHDHALKQWRRPPNFDEPVGPQSSRHPGFGHAAQPVYTRTPTPQDHRNREGQERRQR